MGQRKLSVSEIQVLDLLLVRALNLLWLAHLQWVVLQAACPMPSRLLSQQLFLCCQAVALQIGSNDLGRVSTQPPAGSDDIPEALCCTQLGQLPPAADTASTMVAVAALLSDFVVLYKDFVKADIVGCGGAN